MSYSSFSAAAVIPAIRQHATEPAPVTVRDIEYALNLSPLSGRGRGGNMSRLVRDTPGLCQRRISRDGKSVMAYWFEDAPSDGQAAKRKPSGRLRGDVQTDVLRVVRGVTSVVTCEEIARSTGLSVKQVSSASNRLAESHKIRRSCLGRVMYLRRLTASCPPGHVDVGFGMIRNRNQQQVDPPKPKAKAAVPKAEPAPPSAVVTEPEVKEADKNVKQGRVYMDEFGKYLIAIDRTTHTGRHVDLYYTSELNQATVFDLRDERAVQNAYPGLLGQLLPMVAEVHTVRTVKLVRGVK